MELLFFVLTGVLAGLAAGLLGVGGGIIIVPALIYLLPMLNLPSADVLHIAIATSLAAIIPTSLVSAYNHHKRDVILWSVAKRLVPGLIVGSLLGAVIVLFISRTSLQLLYAFFLLIVAIRLLSSNRQPAVKQKPKDISMLAGGVIGLISAMMGVGGGTMTVPYLLWRGVSIHHAVATSALCGLPIAISGSIAFWLLPSELNTEQGISLVYLPALIGIVAGSVVAVPLGVKFAHYIKAAKLQLLFGLFLIIVATKLIFDVN